MIKDNSIDVLILSAGIISELSPVESIDFDKLKEIVLLNYLSNFRMIKNFYPLLKNQIIQCRNISSVKDYLKSIIGVYTNLL